MKNAGSFTKGVISLSTQNPPAELHQTHVN